MKRVDYYGHWNKKRRNNFLWDREKESARILSKIIKKDASIFDAGCGNGRFMRLILEKFRNMNLGVTGIDYSKSEVAEAKRNGLKVSWGDIEKGIRAKNESADIFYAGEVIEHLYNPDKLIEEANRITKKGGFLVLTTPNLCAWFNRILLLLGMQPLFIEPSTKSKMIGAGILKRFKQDSQPVGHVRIFTYNALKDILEINGFKILDVKGAIFDSGLPKPVLLIDRLFKIYPRLSSNLVILARKIR